MSIAPGICKRITPSISKRVLIVEDDPTVAEIYQSFCKQMVIPYDICHNLSDSLKLLKENKYSFLILDGNFPLKENAKVEMNYMHILRYLFTSSATEYQRPYVSIISGNICKESLSYYQERHMFDDNFSKADLKLGDLLSRIDQYPHGISVGRRVDDHLQIELGSQSYSLISQHH